MEIDNENILVEKNAEVTISFGKSASKNYVNALNLCKLESTCKVTDKGAVSVTLSTCNPEKIEEIIGIVIKWKSSSVKINNKEIDKKLLRCLKTDMPIFFNCLQERSKYKNPEMPCSFAGYGGFIDILECNIWKCHNCGLGQNFGGLGQYFGASSGGFGNEKNWYFDKSGMKEKLLDSIAVKGNCPFFDKDRALKIIDELPESVDLSSNKQWTYHGVYSSIGSTIGVEPITIDHYIDAEGNVVCDGYLGDCPEHIRNSTTIGSYGCRSKFTTDSLRIESSNSEIACFVEGIDFRIDEKIKYIDDVFHGLFSFIDELKEFQNNYIFWNEDGEYKFPIVFLNKEKNESGYRNYIVFGSDETDNEWLDLQDFINDHASFLLDDSTIDESSLEIIGDNNIISENEEKIDDDHEDIEIGVSKELTETAAKCSKAVCSLESKVREINSFLTSDNDLSDEELNVAKDMLDKWTEQLYELIVTFGGIESIEEPSEDREIQSKWDEQLQTLEVSLEKLELYLEKTKKTGITEEFFYQKDHVVTDENSVKLQAENTPKKPFWKKFFGK